MSFRLGAALAAVLAATATGLQVQISASESESASASIMPLLYATSSIGAAAAGSQSALISNAVARLEAEDRLASVTARGAWVRSSPTQAAAFVSEQSDSTKYRHKYGFYLHTYNQPAACIHLLNMVRKNYPEEPIYIMSDGGMDFTGLCEKVGNCNFQWRPAANDRWNPKPFFERFREAATWLGSKYVVMLEPDNEVQGKIYFDPTEDAGGLADANPAFGANIRHYVEKLGQKANGNSSFVLKWERFGLCGGSYFRSAAILDAFNPATVDWHELRRLDNKRVWSSDVAMPLSLALHGYSYYPWKDITQLAVEKKWGTPARLPAFRHYGRDEPNKPFYNTGVTLVEKGLVVPYVSDKPIGKVICQGCVWESDAVCWEQNPLRCPITYHDSGPVM